MIYIYEGWFVRLQGFLIQWGLK